MFKFVRVFLLPLLVLVIIACSSVKLDDANSSTSVNDSRASTYDPISDQKSGVYGKRSIYFVFDSYTIDPKYAPVISSHAQYLKSFDKQKPTIIIQGNTDDRGTTEYNLALGERRSEAVKKALIALGVNESYVEAVSFGKEKPVNPAQTEEAYKENRRADIVYH